jgi:hypothetical protein
MKRVLTLWGTVLLPALVACGTTTATFVEVDKTQWTGDAFAFDLIAVEEAAREKLSTSMGDANTWKENRENYCSAAWRETKLAGATTPLLTYATSATDQGGPWSVDDKPRGSRAEVPFGSGFLTLLACFRSPTHQRQPIPLDDFADVLSGPSIIQLALSGTREAPRLKVKEVKARTEPKP